MNPSVELKFEKFLDTLTWFHKEKDTPTGVYNAIGEISKNLGRLNNNIEAANDSSTKLTKALNNITLWGVIIADVGLLISILNIFLRVK